MGFVVPGSAPDIDSLPTLIDLTNVSDQKPKLYEPTVEYSPNASRASQKPTPEVDLSHLERNLALTPEERLIEHQHALELVLALEAAGRKLREERPVGQRPVYENFRARDSGDTGFLRGRHSAIDSSNKRGVWLYP